MNTKPETHVLEFAYEKARKRFKKADAKIRALNALIDAGEDTDDDGDQDELSSRACVAGDNCRVVIFATAIALRIYLAEVGALVTHIGWNIADRLFVEGVRPSDYFEPDNFDVDMVTAVEIMDGTYDDGKDEAARETDALVGQAIAVIHSHRPGSLITLAEAAA
jgi:hypothetical protein